MTGEFLQEYSKAAQRDIEARNQACISALILDCWPELIRLVIAAERVAGLQWRLDELDRQDKALRDALDSLDRKAATRRSDGD